MNYLKYCLAPPKIKWALRKLGNKERVTILDVGCGNHSPRLTKRYIPQCEYHGVDITEYNLDSDDKRLMDRFTIVDINGGGYNGIQKDYYDYIILNHVIEHMKKYEPVLDRLCQCLRLGGCIYIAFPAEKSLAMPSAEGTLQFSDDMSHLYLPSIREVANVLLKNRVKVVYGGRSKDLLRSTIGIPLLAWQYFRRAFGQKMHARGLWFILGFESVVIGVKEFERGSREQR